MKLISSIKIIIIIIIIIITIVIIIIIIFIIIYYYYYYYYYQTVHDKRCWRKSVRQTENSLERGQVVKHWLNLV